MLGILLPGRQGYIELNLRLVLAAALAFTENTASTLAFSAAQRGVGGGVFLYLLPGFSGALGALLLCWGDMRRYRWSRWKDLVRVQRPRNRIERERVTT